MDVAKVLETVIKIDKKIFRIYEDMTINDCMGKSNDEKIKELKGMLELENWSYKKMNLSYENLKCIINQLEKQSINFYEQELNEKILLDKIKFSCNILSEYRVDDKFLEQLVLCRIYDYLSKLYYLDDRTPKDVNCYVEKGVKIPKNDDITDIYITDDSYLKMRFLNSKEYVRKAVNEHSIVLAFNKSCKKELELAARTDIEQVIIMLLEVKSDIDVQNRYFYIDELYRRIFNNKDLEDRIVRSDFSFDDLIEQFSIQSSSIDTNRNFLEVYRGQLSYLTIYDLIHYLFSFVDSEFIGNDILNKYNLVLFNIYVEELKGYISVMRSDELTAIKSTIYKHYHDIIENNVCAKIVYSCFDETNYERLHDFINMGVNNKKEKLK